MPLSMNNDEQIAQFGVTKRQKAMLSTRVIRISKGYCKRIGKYRCCVMKGDTVLSSVHFRLFRIPLKFHSVSPLIGHYTTEMLSSALITCQKNVGLLSIVPLLIDKANEQI